MIDIIKAVSNQGTFMIHIVDGIEAINFDHSGQGPGVKVPEGMVFAGLDPVATDLACARYMFKNVPLEEALKVQLDDGTGGRFPQRVPIPFVDGNNIATRAGFDCPLSRDKLFMRAEERGLGVRKYYVSGREASSDCLIVSLKGHLGKVSEGTFVDLITTSLYFDVFKMPWDMQNTAFSYLESIDQMTNSSLKKEFLEAFDEDGDGIVTYDDFGKKGIWYPSLFRLGNYISMLGTERLKYLKGQFQAGTARIKSSDAQWNPEGHDLMKEFLLGATCLIAMKMSQAEIEAQDPFYPELTWGKSKWPSYQLASYTSLGIALYGSQFPNQIDIASLYGAAFRYADLTQNKGQYSGTLDFHPDLESINNYISNVQEGSKPPLDFTFYVPPNFDKIAGSNIPNVEVATDPGNILTASFSGGKETW